MMRTSLMRNFATSQWKSAWNSQLRFEVHDLIDSYQIPKFVSNLENFKWTLETVCQKFSEMHCNIGQYFTESDNLFMKS